MGKLRKGEYLLERLQSGIGGLDQAFEGFPKGRTVLLTGDAGSGKTILALQFSMTSCEAGLKTVYLTTEEEKVDLYLQAGSFGWDFSKYSENGNFELLELTRSRIQDIESSIDIRVPDGKGSFDELLEILPEDTQVLVIDSLGSHTSNLGPREFKDRLDVLIFNLNKRKITTMLILDSATSHEYNDMAMFSVHGALVLSKRENPYTGRRERVMDVVKMRNTKTPIQLLTFEINGHGIILSSAENNIMKV